MKRTTFKLSFKVQSKLFGKRFFSNFKILEVKDENMKHIMSKEEFVNELDRLSKRFDLSAFDRKIVDKLNEDQLGSEKYSEYLESKYKDSIVYKGPVSSSKYKDLSLSTPVFIFLNFIFLTGTIDIIYSYTQYAIGKFAIIPGLILLCLYPLSWVNQLFAIGNLGSFTRDIKTHNELVRLSHKYKE